MKFLIAGLGNVGEAYFNTRHNIGFQVVDALAMESDVAFTADRYASVARIKFKGRTFVLIKPSTYMNLSGKAVSYWLQKEKIAVGNMLVITDDIALPFGTLRMRAKGSDGGHNGLKSINENLGSNDYPRLRFGVGNEFSKGRQVDHVLGEWTEEETGKLEERKALALKMITSFGTIGVQRTMSEYNNK